MPQRASLRRRIAIVGIVFMLTVAACGALAWWVAVESRQLFLRSQLAHDVATAYYRLSALSYALFKQHMDQLLLGESANQAALRGKEEAIRRAIERLRALIQAEIALIAPAEQAEETELALLDEIAGQLDAILAEFRQLHRLESERMILTAGRPVLHTLEQSIDTRFRGLIHRAIEEEERETLAAEALALERTRQLAWLAQGMVVAGALIAVLGILWLTRGLRRPLDDLLTAMAALQGDALDHRVTVTGPREFARIAEGFNAMAKRIAAQRRGLEQARQSLEATVAERTEALREANRALADVDRRRRAFLADISHELRTPLTIIRGESQVALRGPDKVIAEYRDALQRVHEQARHLSRLVDDLLYIARGDANAVPELRESVDLTAVLRGVALDFHVIGARAGVTIAVDDPLPAAIVDGEPDRLRQLFAILVENAIAYSDPGGAVRITLASGADGHRVTVADRGIGIAPADLPHVFERFYRGADARVRRRDGSGLGLPVARAIVAAHGGEIACASTLGAGTRFTVRLANAGPGLESTA